MGNNARVTKGVSAPEIDVRQLPTADAFARQSGAITTSPYPMLIYFAFYIFPTRVPSTREQLENHPAGSTYGSKLHSVGRAPPENTINHFSPRFKTSSSRQEGSGKKSWNFLRKSPRLLDPCSYFYYPCAGECETCHGGEGKGKGNRHRCAVLQSDIDLTRLCRMRGWKIARVPGNSPTVAGFSSLNLYKVWRILNEFYMCSFLSGKKLRIYVDFRVYTHIYIYICMVHTIISSSFSIIFRVICEISHRSNFLRVISIGNENQISV